MFTSPEPEPSSACKSHFIWARAELSLEIKNISSPSWAKLGFWPCLRAEPSQPSSSQLELEPARYTLTTSKYGVVTNVWKHYFVSLNMCHLTCGMCHMSWVTCTTSKLWCSLKCLKYVLCVFCHVSCVRLQVSGVRCHVSLVMCHVSCVTCHVLCDSCHMSVRTTATAFFSATSPNSRLIKKSLKTFYGNPISLSKKVSISTIRMSFKMIQPRTI